MMELNQPWSAVVPKLLTMANTAKNRQEIALNILNDTGGYVGICSHRLPNFVVPGRVIVCPGMTRDGA